MTVNRTYTVLIGLGCFALGLAYFLFKTYQLAGDAGYDYKFIWVAGKIWLSGANPYDAGYLDAATGLVTDGNIPDLWVYPPNWWGLAAGFGLLDLAASAVAWNLSTIVQLMLVSLILTDAHVVRTRAYDMRILLFGVHFLLLALLESTAIVLSAGQTSVLITLGIALLLWAQAREMRWPAVLGLALLFLKPQIGGIFAILWLVLGRETRIQLMQAVIVSAILCIPAMLREPFVVLDFFRNLTAYDGFTAANDAVSMTGIRIGIYELLGLDIGNIPATALTLVVALALALWMERRGCGLWEITMAAVAVILALAPLHTYDLVIAAPLFFVFLQWRGGLVTAVAALGTLILLRSENWADLTGFYSEGVDIFPGSRIATIGAVILGVAVIAAVWREPRRS